MTAQELLAEGYRHGAPNATVAAIDRPIAEGLPCRCGADMQYDAWHNPDTGSYIALAVCPKCGAEEEF